MTNTVDQFEEPTLDLDFIEASERDAALCRWGELRDTADEAAFREWRREQDVQRARLITVVAATAFALMGIRDANVVISGIDHAVISVFRTATVCLLFVAAAMTWLRKPGAWIDRWLLACLLSFTPVVCAVRALRPAEFYLQDMSAAVVVVMGSFLVFPTTWFYRWLSMTVFMTSVLAVGVGLSVPTGELVQASCFLWAAYVVAGLGSLSSERHARMQFVRLAEERASRERLQQEADLRVTVEHALRESRDEALASARAKSAFLATMSHELRTPINGIVGMTELLREGELADRQQGYVSSIGSAAKALTTLLADILDVSRVEEGTLEVSSEPFAIADVMRESAHLIAPLAEAKALHLEQDVLVDGGGWVTGDAARLRQVILNLLSNAVKFTHRGTVTLRARAYEVDGFTGAEIEVVDTGIGIAADRQDEIFEPFHQIDQGTSRQFGGAGLGLALAHGLVRGMGGVLELESELGVGSTFRIRMALPTAQPPAHAEVEMVEESAVVHILVVDDQAVNRLVTSRMLSADGHIVTLANDGIEALEACDEKQFDLIFMDISMPRMDGLEAMQHLRSRSGWESDVPIVALTAHALPDDVTACLEAGATAHESKPVDRQTLRRLVSLADDMATITPQMTSEVELHA